MRTDLGTEAVLEWCDDATPVGVVLRIRTRDHQHVQRQAQVVTANLDVAFLEDVEQRNLDALDQVRKFVHREDAAVGPRDQTEVDGLGVSKAATFGNLHRIDVAYQISNRRIRRRELLAVPLAAMTPGDGEVLAKLASQTTTTSTHRRRWFIVDLTALDVGHPLVEQPDERADQPCLALPPLPQQNKVVSGQQSPLHLGPNGVFESDDARQRRQPIAQATQEVLLHLGLHRARLISTLQKFGLRAGQFRWRYRCECGHLLTVRRAQALRDLAAVKAWHRS